ncbi:carboxypeptidase-like regulatory domain-containing protein [Salibacter halophilus]|uniref:Carboxypeptidase-like regulatory domain-containing protein n=1 Tax=Salibacter halophilus TaxID=1803916 RepID=A0A6N6MBB6_9FLAO|nr:carboxypeptidase-like regulatory domain-containing protein [Salibacter halophilus]KAB1065721.1 carboxypeptidase-like regulatory domain-containing protein [Salibacter halophilus]
MIKKLTSIFSLIAILFALGTHESKAQDENLLQFSGVILDADSLNPLPFSTVIIKNTNRGTTSDYYGFFSFVAEPGDTIRFSNVGYRSELYIIPDTLQTSRYSMIQLLNRDTVELKEVTVYPWPTKEQFKEAFLSLNTPDDDYQRAMRNLRQATMRDKIMNMPMADGSANFKYAMQNRNSQIYSAGQFPSYTIFNPLAWAKFISAWKNGDFKQE